MEDMERSKLVHGMPREKDVERSKFVHGGKNGKKDWGSQATSQRADSTRLIEWLIDALVPLAA